MENKRLKPEVAYPLVVFLVACVVVSGYLYMKVANNDSFAPGVEIGGVLVEGDSPDEAVDVLEQSITAIYAVPVTFYKDDYSSKSKLGDLCFPIDTRKVVQDVWKEEKNRSWRSKIANLNGRQKVIYPVVLPYNPEAQNKLVQEWNNKWGIAARNASLEINQNKILLISNQMGREVDAETTFKPLPEAMAQVKAQRVAIVVISKEPQITDAMLGNMGQLSSYTTQYNASQVNRSSNIAIAASSIDKNMVAPHTVFSFNNAVGQCTAAQGYLEAMVIVAGKFEPGLAGGICQVSSTLYNASLLAGMDIVERHNHSLSVGYVPLGRDATVSGSSCDFQFINNTDYPIYIRAAASGGRLTISMYGNLMYKKKIVISNVIDQTFGFATITKLDPNLTPGTEKVDHNGQPGYIVRTYRSLYGENGQVERTEMLSRDTYYPLDKLVYIGPEPAPKPQADEVAPPASGQDVPEPNSTEEPEQPASPENSDQSQT